MQSQIARVEPLTRTRAVRGPFDYRLPDELAEVEVGSLLRVPFGGQRALAVVTELASRSELPPERLSEPEEVLPLGVPSDLVSLALWMAHEYCSTPARALGLVLAPGAKTRRTTRTMKGTPASYAVGAVSSIPPELNSQQRAALDELLAVLDGRRHEQLLLHGVTGSGKTELYLRAAGRALESGRTAIVLVPEIALTPQALGRFRARFGEQVALLHSGITAGQRFAEWMRLRRGEARVCVGPRSAVFAPLQNIGLIIVDEEHEGAYKHEGDPRYDARAVALWRARTHDALLVLGSATPRPETFHGARRLLLGERIDGRALPPVELLDMRGHDHPLHPKTRAALAEVRRSEGKAIVLLNRRGWSNFLSCRGCGRAWMCPNCEVALVLHQGFVACHHCGHHEPDPERCPKCGSTTVARHGAGTERIEHELGAALGGTGFPILRLDADSASFDGRARTLEAFASAPAGVLVGTQMVAKGHDFPDVTLGVVLDADQTLRFPDFRAEERTFSLIAQLAGRAGRGDAGGRVLVQTLAPEARAIRLAATHDANGFLAGELARREALGYPPFSSLIRIVCSAARSGPARAAAEALHALIQAPHADVLGPAPLFALRGKARSQLVIKAREREAAIEAVGAAVETLARGRGAKGVSVSVDVDPI